MVLLFIDSKRFDFMRFTRAMLLSIKSETSLTQNTILLLEINDLTLCL